MSVFADELALLAGSSAEVLTWLHDAGRSFGVRPYLATQRISQLPPALAESILDYGTVCWFVQSNPDVAERAARDLSVDGSAWSPADVTNLPPVHRGRPHPRRRAPATRGAGAGRLLRGPDDRLRRRPGLPGRRRSHDGAGRGRCRVTAPGRRAWYGVDDTPVPFADLDSACPDPEVTAARRLDPYWHGLWGDGSQASWLNRSLLERLGTDRVSRVRDADTSRTREQAITEILTRRRQRPAHRAGRGRDVAHRHRRAARRHHRAAHHPGRPGDAARVPGRTGGTRHPDHRTRLARPAPLRAAVPAGRHRAGPDHRHARLRRTGSPSPAATPGPAATSRTGTTCSPPNWACGSPNTATSGRSSANRCPGTTCSPPATPATPANRCADLTVIRPDGMRIAVEITGSISTRVRPQGRPVGGAARRHRPGPHRPRGGVRRRRAAGPRRTGRRRDVAHHPHPGRPRRPPGPRLRRGPGAAADGRRPLAVVVPGLPQRFSRVPHPAVRPAHRHRRRTGGTPSDLLDPADLLAPAEHAPATPRRSRTAPPCSASRTGSANGTRHPTSTRCCSAAPASPPPRNCCSGTRSPCAAP